MKMCIAILLGVAGVLLGFKTYAVQQIPQSNGFISGKEEESSNMKREFCKVVEGEPYFVLENTKGEIYHLDKSLGKDFKDGDEVLLIYTERREIGDKTYEADVYAVYPDNSELKMPAR